MKKLMFYTIAAVCTFQEIATTKAMKIAPNVVGSSSSSSINNSRSLTKRVSNSLVMEELINYTDAISTTALLNKSKRLMNKIRLVLQPHLPLITILQDRVIELERQIRLGRDEITQLRILLKKQQKKKRSSNSLDSKRAFVVESELREDVEHLADKVSNLKSIKDEMQELLKKEKRRTLQLQKDVEKGREMLQDEKERMAELKKETEKELKRMMESLKDMERVQKETSELLQKEREAFELRLKTEVEEERKRGLEAVEVEKLKLRKLAKVLALREKKEALALQKKKKKGKNSSKKKNPTDS